MIREQFIELQTRELDELFSLTGGEDELRERFFQLALDTYDFLASVGINVLWGFHLWGESSENYFGRQRGAPAVPASLDRRWHDWNAEYPKLLSRNPRLALMFLMKEISESHTASSWPAGYERRIQAWVDLGDASAQPPFDDRYGIVTPAFYQRLRELRRLCGGWLYWNCDLDRVVFAPEPEWQRVRAAQELAESDRRKRREEEEVKMERLRRRLDEVLSLARADATFWQALKMWELEQEAQPREEPRVHAPLSRPIQLVARTMAPEEKQRWDNPPLHPVFAEFIRRVHQPDDIMSTRDIVSNLRGEIRRELGLKGSTRW